VGWLAAAAERQEAVVVAARGCVALAATNRRRGRVTRRLDLAAEAAVGALMAGQDDDPA
jgi:hypothetical protein